MSHEAVQAVLERTLSDESFRTRLFSKPDDALTDYELTDDEVTALRALSVETDPGTSAELDQRRSKAPLWTTGL